jgi:hypothetical protein
MTAQAPGRARGQANLLVVAPDLAYVSRQWLIGYYLETDEWLTTLLARWQVTAPSAGAPWDESLAFH